MDMGKGRSLPSLIEPDAGLQRHAASHQSKENDGLADRADAASDSYGR